jgi:hypothetical protein
MNRNNTFCSEAGSCLSDQAGLSLLLIVSYCRFEIHEFAEASFVIKAKEKEKYLTPI